MLTLRAQTIIGLFMVVAWFSISDARASDGQNGDLTNFARPATSPFPAFNPPSEAKRLLGERLFHDTALSGGNTMSCATCHQEEVVWADPLASSPGETGVPGKRRTPPLQDIAWETSFGRDGRGFSLEGFILGPISHKDIMNQDLQALLPELAQNPAYPPLFDDAFGEETPTLGGVTQSIATYMRSLLSETSAFDRWLAGDDSAMNDNAKAGFSLFRGEAGCVACHRGWRFTDNRLHDIGLNTDDLGRAANLPDDPLAQHAFKTPSLRNVAIRAPYMHDGSIKTLAEVIDHYVTGIQQRSSVPDDLKRNLDQQQKHNLVLFLETLTDDDRL